MMLVVVDRAGLVLEEFSDVVKAKRWLDQSRNGYAVLSMPDNIVLAQRRAVGGGAIHLPMHNGRKKKADAEPDDSK